MAGAGLESRPHGLIVARLRMSRCAKRHTAGWCSAWWYTFPAVEPCDPEGRISIAASAAEGAMSVLALWPWLCWCWFAAEAVMAVVFRTRRSGGSVRDRGSLLLIFAAITAALMSSDWIVKLAPWSIPGGAAWLRPVSMVVLILGLAVRAAAILTLGRSFSMNVAIRNLQRVQRAGLYCFVRHPSYLGMEIGLLAIGLHSRNWACLAWIVGLPTLALLYRIHVEEAVLHEAFGDEYAAYSRVTKRLIPGVF
jgi:protein-S-isoprenylcysteine O-methyltransferase Ste14